MIRFATLKLGLAGVVAMAALVAAGRANAALITYTNQASWEAAVGTHVLENFNSQTVREFSSTISESGFNGFTLSGTKGGDSVGIRTGSAVGNINATQFLGWQNGDGDVGPVINFNFAQPVNGFAFNWRDTDPTDEYELLVDGQSFFNPPFSSGTSSGFFGVVKTDGTFTSVTIRNATGQTPGGIVDPFGVDDVRTASAVPEPGTFALLGVGALGLVGYSWRRWRNRAA